MPIDVSNGNLQLEYKGRPIPGKVPLVWDRRYSAKLIGRPREFLGPGWTCRYQANLTRNADGFEFFTATGSVESFPDREGAVERGETIRQLGAFMEIFLEAGRYIVQTWSVESGEVWRYCFVPGPLNLPMPLAAIEDPTGQGLDLERDSSGRLIAIRQRLEKRLLQLHYYINSLLKSVSLRSPNGQTHLLARYEYDALGRLNAAFDALDYGDRYEYDAQGRLIREMAKHGGVFSYRYDDKGRCISYSGLGGYDQKRLRFLDAAFITEVKNSYGVTSRYRYTSSGQIVCEWNPLGAETLTEYDAHGRIITEVAPTGATTRYAYDDEGNRNRVTDPLGHTYRFTFNRNHQPLSLTDPLGNTWLRKYDGKNRLVATQNPLGARWTVDYDEAGNPTALTDPLGSSARQRFSDGMPLEMTDWMGHVTRFNWNAFGRVIERIGPAGERTVFKYDAVGNPIEVDLPNGARLLASYDSAGNLTSFTNGKGHVTRFRYGPCHRLLEQTDPMGGCVRYVWGSEPDQLKAVVNEKGETCTYFRDQLGRVVRELSFDCREHCFEYDAADRCIAFTNGNGEKIKSKRDAAGRLLELALPDATVIRYEFDPLGRMTAATNSDRAVSFEYDSVGRLVCETQGDFWVRNFYNSAGEVVRTVTSLGHEVLYQLDPNGRVKKLSTGNNYSISFERDPHGLETLRQMPSRMQLEQRFDRLGRLVEQRVGRTRGTPENLSGFPRILPGDEDIKRDYHYDPDGLLLSIADGRWGGTHYTHDPAEQLLCALRDEGLNEWFEYDPTGNLTRMESRRDESADQICAYGPGNRLFKRGDTHYDYDREGRLIRKTEAFPGVESRVWEYTWDALGQLRKIRRPDGQEWEYKYDAFGRRTEKLGPAGGRQFIWEGDVIIQEVPDLGQTVAWIMDRISFAPLAKVQGGALYSVINDHLGTPREMLDPSGRQVWAASHRAWGQVEWKEIESTEYDCPIRFQGQWLDEESGLHYNRLRYYDPAGARFISQDPIGLMGGKNLYQYVRNPVAWIDPFGLAKMKCQGKENLRNMGMEDVELAGSSYNKGKKQLEAAGFEHVGTTATGRQVFEHPDTGARVTYDSGKALGAGQDPHWTIQDLGGQYYDRSGRPVNGPNPPMGGRHIPGA